MGFYQQLCSYTVKYKYLLFMLEENTLYPTLFQLISCELIICKCACIWRKKCWPLQYIVAVPVLMKSALQLYSTTRGYCGQERSCKHLLTTCYLTAEIYYSQIGGKNSLTFAQNCNFSCIVPLHVCLGELNCYRCLLEAQGHEIELFSQLLLYKSMVWGVVQSTEIHHRLLSLKPPPPPPSHYQHRVRITAFAHEIKVQGVLLTSHSLTYTITQPGICHDSLNTTTEAHAGVFQWKYAKWFVGLFQNEVLKINYFDVLFETAAAQWKKKQTNVLLLKCTINFGIPSNLC